MHHQLKFTPCKTQEQTGFLLVSVTLKTNWAIDMHIRRGGDNNIQPGLKSWLNVVEVKMLGLF